jgi:hypothetical protein
VLINTEDANTDEPKTDEPKTDEPRTDMLSIVESPNKGAATVRVLTTVRKMKIASKAAKLRSKLTYHVVNQAY